MRMLLSGGGTAGHIYPALAVADRLVAEGHEVSFVGTPDGLEARLVPEAGIPFHAIAARGFDRSYPFTLVTSGLVVLSNGGRPLLYGRKGQPVQRFQPYAVDVIDSAGAGDSFRAGLAYGILQGWSDLETIRYASALGAIASGGAAARHPPVPAPRRSLRDLGLPAVVFLLLVGGVAGLAWRSVRSPTAGEAAGAGIDQHLLAASVDEVAVDDVGDGGAVADHLHPVPLACGLLDVALAAEAEHVLPPRVAAPPVVPAGVSRDRVEPPAGRGWGCVAQEPSCKPACLERGEACLSGPTSSTPLDRSCPSLRPSLISPMLTSASTGV